jgi:two-component system, NarL family, response regulator LiaR
MTYVPFGRHRTRRIRKVIDKDDKNEETVLRTIVADDDPLVRRLIRDTLQRADVTVIAEASTGREAVELALFYRPDVVVMDYMMPEMDGIEATRRIYESDPSIRVVLLTGAGDEELGLRGLRAGASGYLSKEVELDALPRALRGALEGEAAISRRLAMHLVQHYRSAPNAGMGLRPVRSKLTDREWEVLDLLSGGASTDDVARLLVLSTETVRSHLKNLYRKLEVRTREEAIAAAARLRELGGVAA